MITGPTAGIILVCITLLLALLIGVNKIVWVFFLKDKLQLKPLDKKWTDAIWITISTFCIIYYLTLRYSTGVQNLINDPNGAGTFDGDRNYSITLFLDACSFSAFFIPVTIILDRKQLFIKSFAVVGLIGGVLTLLTFETSNPDASLSWQFVFFEDKLNDSGQFVASQAPISYFMHSWLILICTTILVYSKKFNWREFWNTFNFFFLYVLYVIIMSNAIGVTHHATGLVKGDFYNINNDPEPPSYGVVATMFGGSTLWGVLAFVLYIALFLMGALIIVFKNYCHFAYSKFSLHKQNIIFMDKEFEFLDDNWIFRESISTYKYLSELKK